MTGDDTLALQSVLESWTVRENLLKEEKELNAKMANGEATSEAQSQRLQVILSFNRVQMTSLLLHQGGQLRGILGGGAIPIFRTMKQGILGTRS